MEYLLFNRLLNVVNKYEEHFKEKPTTFDSIINAFNEKCPKCIPQKD